MYVNNNNLLPWRRHVQHLGDVLQMSLFGVALTLVHHVRLPLVHQLVVVLVLLGLAGLEHQCIEHHVLPVQAGIHLVEVHLLHLALLLHVYPEVVIAEHTVHAQLRRFSQSLNSASGGLNKHVLIDPALSSLQQHPAVHPPAQIRVGLQLVSLVIVDFHRLPLGLLLGLFFFLPLLVKLRFDLGLLIDRKFVFLGGLLLNVVVFLGHLALV